MNKTQFKALVNGLREGASLAALEQLNCFRGISLKAKLKEMKLTVKAIKASQEFSMLLECPVVVGNIEVVKVPTTYGIIATDEETRGASLAISLVQKDAALILKMDEGDYIFLSLTGTTAVATPMTEAEAVYIKSLRLKTEHVNPALLSFALQVI